VASDWYLADVPRLIAETDALYARIAEKFPGKTKESLTIQKIVEEREWGETLDVYKDRFGGVVRQLGCFYVPKVMSPGPAFVFPMRSVDGTHPRAQTKPLEGSALMGEGVKYRCIGDKERYLGPNWLGNDPDTLALIIQRQAVMCVEGPFDLLAIRLACPGYPVLSPLTKRLGKAHVSYLRILGIKRLFLMYDNEAQGDESMEQQRRQITSMLVVPCECPQKDPSLALKKREWAKELSSRIRQQFEY
jgi:hypothetical protein